MGSHNPNGGILFSLLRRNRARAALDEKHSALGGAPGGAATDVVAGPRGGYFRVHRNGILYWSPARGAFWVNGPILGKYLELSGPFGFLGYPATDERVCPDHFGRHNHFEGGSIYWSPGTGAHEVHGAIRDRWAALGWETFLGYPITDELATPDGVGRFNHFRRLGANGDDDASIYFTPATGTHEVYGAIRQHWSELGWEQGPLGYPTTGEQGNAPRRLSHFQGGWIRFQGDHPIRIIGSALAGPGHRRITWRSNQHFDHYNLFWETLYPAPPYAQPGHTPGDPGGNYGWRPFQKELGGGNWGSYLWSVPSRDTQSLMLQGCIFNGVFAGSSCTSWVEV